MNTQPKRDQGRKARTFDVPRVIEGGGGHIVAARKKKKKGR